jgi:hypothetical protein
LRLPSLLKGAEVEYTTEEKKDRTERERKKIKRGWFFVYFSLRFLVPQCPKSTLIYKGGKGYFVFIEDQFWPLVQAGKIPTVGSKESS